MKNDPRGEIVEVNFSEQDEKGTYAFGKCGHIIKFPPHFSKPAKGSFLFCFDCKKNKEFAA